MTDSLFVLKTDFDMVTYELRDKTELLAQYIMRLILDVDQMKKDIVVLKEDVAMLKEDVAALKEDMKQVKADINRMDAKLDLIIKHLKI